MTDTSTSQSMNMDTVPTATATVAPNPVGFGSPAFNPSPVAPTGVNPFAFVLPLLHPRYSHGSHRHRLFLGVGVPNRRCDQCQMNIKPMDSRFFCHNLNLGCEWDICTTCFVRDATHPVTFDPVEDSQINDSVLGQNSDGSPIRVVDFFRQTVQHVRPFPVPGSVPGPTSDEECSRWPPAPVSNPWSNIPRPQHHTSRLPFVPRPCDNGFR